MHQIAPVLDLHDLKHFLSKFGQFKVDESTGRVSVLVDSQQAVWRLMHEMEGGNGYSGVSEEDATAQALLRLSDTAKVTANQDGRFVVVFPGYQLTD